MDTIFQSSLLWWVTAVELPVFSGLFWMILKARQDAQEATDILQQMLDVRTTQLKESFLTFKLEVAKSYASVTDMKDLEARIVSHLLRIESKLDRTALKTEALKASKTE